MKRRFSCIFLDASFSANNIYAQTHACSLYNIIMYLFTAIGLLPGGSGYFTCKKNMKLVTNKFKSGGLHEKHAVATWEKINK